jgi:hypothetical protein
MKKRKRRSDTMLVKLENGMYLHTYASDNDAYGANCDSVCGYCLFNKERSYADGGEFDYNSDEIKTDEELLKALIEFHFNTDLSYTFIADTDDVCYEDFDELLEDNGIEL